METFTLLCYQVFHTKLTLCTCCPCQHEASMVAAISPSVWLFFVSECVENWIMCLPSQHSFSWQRQNLPVETECFHFLSFFLPLLCFSGFSVCIPLSPHLETVKLLSSSRSGVQCHPTPLDLTGGPVVTEIWSIKLSLRPSVRQCQVTRSEMAATLRLDATVCYLLLGECLPCAGPKISFITALTVFQLSNNQIRSSWQEL